MTSEQEVIPTLAIGIGWAGCSMLSTLHEMTKEEGITDKFRFVGIDSNLDDLRANVDHTAEEVTRYELKAPEQWDDNQHEYHFLEGQLLPGGQTEIEQGGAKRKRRIGRYYIDCHRNFNGLESHLSGVIEEFARTYDDDLDREGSQMNIWIMNSLSGGTGSGSFPVVTGMVREITRNTTWSTGKFKIMGIGALPNTDNVTRDNLNYQLNAYAALRDIQVLIGEDPPAQGEIRLGEEHVGLSHDDRIPFSESSEGGFLFHKYFLQPFNQDEMTKDAYAYQLNRASATLPLYFALVEGQEDWPDNLKEDVNERLYAFDTYELSVPVEDMYRYYAARNKINTLEQEIDDLELEKSRVTNDIAYLDDVLQVNIERYIQDYCEEMERSESHTRMTEVIPDEIDLPPKIKYDMVETARSAVGGATLDEGGMSNVERIIEERYDPEWDATETSDVDHRAVFEYIVYQMVERQTKEERRSHRLHDLIESKWEKYYSELQENFSFLNESDTPQKWQDGLQKFYSNKIAEAERAIPTNALLAGGLLFLVVIFLVVGLIANLGAIVTLTETSATVGSITVSAAAGVIGATMLLSFGCFGFYVYRKRVHASLEDERADCRATYSRYNELGTVQEQVRDRLESLDLGQRQLENRKSRLERTLEEKRKALDNQKTVKEGVVERLDDFEIEYDRKVDFPIRDAEEKLPMQGIEQKIHEYIQAHPSINLDVVSEDLFDVDTEIEMEEQNSEREYEESPDSIGWFTSRDIIDEADISTAFNDILTDDSRLAKSHLQDYTNENPVKKDATIIQYLWNDVNRNITDMTGGGSSYSVLVDEDRYNTDQPNAEISDEFKVWLMGVFTDIWLVNAAEYQDIDEVYTVVDDGDRELSEELGLPVPDQNLVSSRFAYPEFYSTDGHPLQDEVEGYPQ